MSAMFKPVVAAIQAKLQANALQLPRLPEVAMQINVVLEDDGCDFGKVADVIASDASVTTRVLQVANSPLVRGRVEITSLKTAVCRLGLDMVRNLVFCIALNDTYESKDPRVRELLRREWRHATAVATLAYVLAQNIRGLSEDIALMMGLVHDIGALPIINFLATREQLLSNDQAVQAIIDATHEEVGAMIAEKWKLPDGFAEVIGDHTRTDKANPGPPDYRDVVIVADLSATGESVTWRDVPSLAKLKLTPESLEKLLAEAQQTIDVLEKKVFGRG